MFDLKRETLRIIPSLTTRFPSRKDRILHRQPGTRKHGIRIRSQIVVGPAIAGHEIQIRGKFHNKHAKHGGTDGVQMTHGPRAHGRIGEEQAQHVEHMPDNGQAHDAKLPCNLQSLLQQDLGEILRQNLNKFLMIRRHHGKAKNINPIRAKEKEKMNRLQKIWMPFGPEQNNEPASYRNFGMVSSCRTKMTQETYARTATHSL